MPPTKLPAPVEKLLIAAQVKEMLDARQKPRRRKRRILPKVERDDQGRGI
jgi:hypothetical protein